MDPEYHCPAGTEVNMSLDLYNNREPSFREKISFSAPSRPGLTWDPGTPPSKQISFSGVTGGSKQKYISVPVAVNPQCWDLLTTGRGRTSAYWPTMTILCVKASVCKSFPV